MHYQWLSRRLQRKLDSIQDWKIQMEEMNSKIQKSKLARAYHNFIFQLHRLESLSIHKLEIQSIDYSFMEIRRNQRNFVKKLHIKSFY